MQAQHSTAGGGVLLRSICYRRSSAGPVFDAYQTTGLKTACQAHTLELCLFQAIMLESRAAEPKII